MMTTMTLTEPVDHCRPAVSTLAAATADSTVSVCSLELNTGDDVARVFSAAAT